MRISDWSSDVCSSDLAPTDADLLSILIDDATKGADPKVKLALFTSDPEADPFTKATVRQANPAFGDFQNADETMAMAEDARRMPSRESEYRNLILNQRSEENTSELQSLMRISYAVFCLK